MTLTETLTGISMLLIAIVMLAASVKSATRIDAEREFETGVHVDFNERESEILNRYFENDVFNDVGGLCAGISDEKPNVSATTNSLGRETDREATLTLAGPARHQVDWTDNTPCLIKDRAIAANRGLAPLHLRTPAVNLDTIDFTAATYHYDIADAPNFVRTTATVPPQPPIITRAEASFGPLFRVTTRARIEVDVPWGVGPVSVDFETSDDEDLIYVRTEGPTLERPYTHTIRLRNVEPPADFVVKASNALGTAEVMVHLPCPKDGLTGRDDHPTIECQRVGK